MNIASTLYLAAILAGPLHAQVCSGGGSGGIDATGNQCNDAATVGLYASAPGIASPQLTGKMSGIQQSTVATTDTPPTAKMSGAPATLTVSAQGASRFAKAVPPPSATVKTSRIEAVDVSPCSGGPAGGMDATGNQCAEYAVAGMSAGNIVVAHH